MSSPFLSTTAIILSYFLKWDSSPWRDISSMSAERTSDMKPMKDSSSPSRSSESAHTTRKPTGTSTPPRALPKKMLSRFITLR